MDSAEYLSLLKTCFLLGVDPIEYFGFQHDDPFIVIDRRSVEWGSIVYIDLQFTYVSSVNHYWFENRSEGVNIYSLEQVAPYYPK